MAEKIIGKLKEIWEKIVAWWNKFTSKQRTLIIVLAAVVVIAFVILYAVLTSPNYTMLEQCKSTKEASQITTVLEGAEIPYKVTDDGLQVKVPFDTVAGKAHSCGFGYCNIGLYHRRGFIRQFHRNRSR